MRVEALALPQLDCTSMFAFHLPPIWWNTGRRSRNPCPCSTIAVRESFARSSSKQEVLTDPEFFQSLSLCWSSPVADRLHLNQHMATVEATADFVDGCFRRRKEFDCGSDKLDIIRAHHHCSVDLFFPVGWICNQIENSLQLGSADFVAWKNLLIKFVDAYSGFDVELIHAFLARLLLARVVVCLGQLSRKTLVSKIGSLEFEKISESFGGFCP